MEPFLARLLPLLYAACLLGLLWQAFRVMAKGFTAVSRPNDLPFPTPFAPASAPPVSTDRTGRLTIHPELLDANGSLTQEDLLTVRFSDDAEETALPPESP
jgi:hypothetical protein